MHKYSPASCTHTHSYEEGETVDHVSTLVLAPLYAHIKESIQTNNELQVPHTCGHTPTSVTTLNIRG